MILFKRDAAAAAAATKTKKTTTTSNNNKTENHCSAMAKHNSLSLAEN